jgi:hypothetical protein
LFDDTKDEGDPLSRLSLRDRRDDNRTIQLSIIVVRREDKSPRCICRVMEGSLHFAFCERFVGVLLRKERYVKLIVTRECNDPEIELLSKSSAWRHPVIGRHVAIF